MNKMKVVKIIVAISIIMIHSPAVPLLFEEFSAKKDTLDIFGTALHLLFGMIFIAIEYHIIYECVFVRFYFPVVESALYELEDAKLSDKIKVTVLILIATVCIYSTLIYVCILQGGIKEISAAIFLVAALVLAFIFYYSFAALFILRRIKTKSEKASEGTANKIKVVRIVAIAALLLIFLPLIYFAYNIKDIISTSDFFVILFIVCAVALLIYKIVIKAVKSVYEENDIKLYKEDKEKMAVYMVIGSLCFAVPLVGVIATGNWYAITASCGVLTLFMLLLYSAALGSVRKRRKKDSAPIITFNATVINRRIVNTGTTIESKSMPDPTMYGLYGQVDIKTKVKQHYSYYITIRYENGSQEELKINRINYDSLSIGDTIALMFKQYDGKKHYLGFSKV